MTRGPQKRSAAIAVLDAHRMRFKNEAAPIGIDEGILIEGEFFVWFAMQYSIAWRCRRLALFYRSCVAAKLQR